MRRGGSSRPQSRRGGSSPAQLAPWRLVVREHAPRRQVVGIALEPRQRLDRVFKLRDARVQPVTFLERFRKLLTERIE